MPPARSPQPRGDLPPRAFWASLIGRSWRSFSGWLVSTRWAVWLLVAINLGSSVVGYVYWYGDDILDSPLYLWPMVPDSPLSATLWAVALLSLAYGRRWSLLGLLAVVGSIKYGLWTDWVWLTNAISGDPYDLEAVVLSLNHFGMVLEGLALVPLLRPRPWHVVFVAAWYGVNDLLDYGMGSHPRVPNPEDIGLITLFAAASTVVLVALAWLLYARRSVEAPSPTVTTRQSG